MKLRYLNINSIIIIFLILLGLNLSLYQYYFNRSLWLDEAMLALNIIHKGISELFEPLNWKQVAPILFLLIEKVFFKILPNSEYGLRLFPLLCYWTSIIFYFLVLKRLFKDDYLKIIGLGFFVFNPVLLYYSSEVKQYMTDVMVLLLIYYFTIKDYKSNNNKYLALGVTGIVAITLSNIAPVVLLPASIYVVIKTNFNYKVAVKKIVFLGILWGTLFSLYYFFFIHDHPTKDFMINYWKQMNAFLPVNPFSQDFFDFISNKSSLIVYSFFQFGKLGGVIIGFLIISGIVQLILTKRTDIIILVLIPMLIHLILSAMKLYPVEKRLILYQLPLFITLILYGIQFYVNILSMRFSYLKNVLGLVITSLIIINFLSKSDFPFEYEEIKESISFIKKNNQDKDGLILYYAADPPYNYYKGTKFPFLKKKKPIIIGSWGNPELIKDINFTKSLKGRYWVLFSHIINNEDQIFLKMMDSAGYERLNSITTVRSGAYLYNINH